MRLQNTQILTACHEYFLFYLMAENKIYMGDSMLQATIDGHIIKSHVS